MKTQIVLIILFQVFFAGSIFSQYKLESKLNLPRPGDEILKQQVTYKDPGRSGVNVLWDFSALGNDSKPYTLTYDTIDGILTGIEHRTRYYYRIWNDSLFVDGYENATTLMQYSQPELVRKFPVAFGDSLFSYFRGEGHYCDRLKVDVMGTLASSADSYGMMILPDKDTLKHVLRIKTVKRTVEDLKPL